MAAQAQVAMRVHLLSENNTDIQTRLEGETRDGLEPDPSSRWQRTRTRT